MRGPTSALLLASIATPAAAEPLWPDHDHFVLKPRISFAIRTPHTAPPQRQARIYAIELAPSPAGPPDIRLALQRRRQRFGTLRAARAVQMPGTDVQPRSSLTLVDAQFDLPDRLMPLGDALTATLGWQAVKISNRAMNVTSAYSRDDLRIRDGFLPTARLALAATDRLDLSADYRETVQAYGDIGTNGALGMDALAFRAFRLGLRPERDGRSRIALRWRAAPGLHLMAHAYSATVHDRLAFDDDAYLPGDAGSAHLRGIRLEASHALSPQLHWSMRYDRARIATDGGLRRIEDRLAVQGQWRRGPWRSAVTLARASTPYWTAAGHRFRVEGGIDYVSPTSSALRIGLHLTDPDRLTAVRLAGQPQSGTVRVVDQARAVMLAAALRW
jgi:hypothetical protein